MAITVKAAAPAPVETPPVVVPPDREAAAEVILNQLPKTIADAIREISLIHNRYPLWVTVAGLVLKAYENGEHQAPILDPSWPRQFDLVELHMGDVKCEWCGEIYKPKRWKQRFCSNDCGFKAREAEKA